MIKLGHFDRGWHYGSRPVLPVWMGDFNGFVDRSSLIKNLLAFPFVCGCFGFFDLFLLYF